MRDTGDDLSLVGKTRAEIVHPVTAGIDARKTEQRVPRSTHNYTLAEQDCASEFALQVNGLMKGLLKLAIQ